MAKVLNKEDSILVIIDIQEKLVKMLKDEIGEGVVKKASALTQAAKIIGIPTILTEQYPKGLGQTVEAVKANAAEGTQVIEKSAFSALAEESFGKILKDSGRKQVVICGIEAHICVHQTAAELLEEGYEVFVAKDACASRNKYEFKAGMERMKDNGAKISCLEIILFEWLKSSRCQHFKEVQAIIK